MRRTDPEAFEKINFIRQLSEQYAKQLSDDKDSQMQIVDQATQRAMQTYQKSQPRDDITLTQNSDSKPSNTKDIGPER